MKNLTISQKRRLIKQLQSGIAAAETIRWNDAYDESIDGRSNYERQQLAWGNISDSLSAALTYYVAQLRKQEQAPTPSKQSRLKSSILDIG